jgi:RNA polymerase sigma factor (sigma-70 family)
MPETPPSLLQRLREHPGDAEAWRRFDHLYRPLLASWLSRHAIQPADRDDLIQDILAAVVRDMPTFTYDPARGKFRSWLRRILAHRVRHWWRHRAGREYHDAVLDQLEDERSSLAQAWDREHDQYVLARLLDVVRPDFEETTWPRRAPSPAPATVQSPPASWPLSSPSVTQPMMARAERVVRQTSAMR